jgi:hypothetical protein
MTARPHPKVRPCLFHILTSALPQGHSLQPTAAILPARALTTLKPRPEVLKKIKHLNGFALFSSNKYIFVTD